MDMQLRSLDARLLKLAACTQRVPSKIAVMRPPEPAISVDVESQLQGCVNEPQTSFLRVKNHGHAVLRVLPIHSGATAFRTLGQVELRESIDVGAKKTGVKFRPGLEVFATQAKEYPERSGERQVRFEQGWASVVQSSATVLQGLGPVEPKQPWLGVDKKPLALEPQAEGKIRLELSATENALLTGRVILETNDPQQPFIAVPILYKVTKRKKKVSGDVPHQAQWSPKIGGSFKKRATGMDMRKLKAALDTRGLPTDGGRDEMERRLQEEFDKGDPWG